MTVMTNYLLEELVNIMGQNRKNETKEWNGVRMNKK